MVPPSVGLKGTVYGETDLYFMFEMSYLGLEELKKNIIIEMLHGKSISSGVLCRVPHLDKKINNSFGWVNSQGFWAYFHRSFPGPPSPPPHNFFFTNFDPRPKLKI